MPRSLERVLAVVGAATVLSACALSPSTPTPVETVSSEGACAEPTLVAASGAGAVHPGDQLELSVENLIPVCADTPATSSHMPDASAEGTVEEFEVVWLQGDTSTVIGAVEPNDGSPFPLAVRVPVDAMPGSASILLSTAELSVEVDG